MKRAALLAPVALLGAPGTGACLIWLCWLCWLLWVVRLTAWMLSEPTVDDTKALLHRQRRVVREYCRHGLNVGRDEVGWWLWPAGIRRD